MIDAFKQSAAWAEFSSNIRLQWMLVAIAAILLISGTKTLFDTLSENRSDAMRTHQMIEKMVAAASNPVSEEAMANAANKVERFYAQIPKVESASIAEAEAFSAASKIINTTIARPRSKLVGTETLRISNKTFWQVRIQIDGGLHELNLIPLLAFFDKKNLQIRLNSLDFQPDTRGNVTLVVDYLYMQGKV
ncbi:hypothetical protein BK026_11820 [Alteromonas sp. V450]|uniref:hypothetical protein n=1 Tax=Alteromonas sp. V450 TaxID=1912139 RepID=UPI0008FF4E54|nr:hypothetical protein [Alteromonas sp. V450]OJF69417.1 hypothetical protein BK026_11820 [Alteromonas sp. V450]|tara:strand:+ start:632 stop:1204 length:573 start_codon:yes stop_codon:yes gene_type:complete